MEDSKIDQLLLLLLSLSLLFPLLVYLMDLDPSYAWMPSIMYFIRVGYKAIYRPKKVIDNSELSFLERIVGIFFAIAFALTILLNYILIYYNNYLLFFIPPIFLAFIKSIFHTVLFQKEKSYMNELQIKIYDKILVEASVICIWHSLGVLSSPIDINNLFSMNQFSLNNIYLMNIIFSTVISALFFFKIKSDENNMNDMIFHLSVSLKKSRWYYRYSKSAREI